MNLDYARCVLQEMLAELEKRYPEPSTVLVTGRDYSVAHQVEALRVVLRQPVLPERTILDALAVAVLKEDELAAMALRDMLEEKVDRQKLNDQARELRQTRRMVTTGTRVYGWPEFRAFCERLGILYDAITCDLVIEMYARGPVNIIQRYMALDTQEGTNEE